MKAPVFCLSGTFLWSLWSNKAFTQACHCLCPFQGFFPIRKEKLHLAKTRSPCERWVQLLPTIQVLLSSPEWHQDFGHPCRPSSFRAMRTPMDPLCHIHEKATGIWALEQSSNPHLPPPAPSHPHPQRWLHFQELMQLFGSFQARRDVRQAKHSSHKNLSDRDDVLVASARNSFSCGAEQG